MRLELEQTRTKLAYRALGLLGIFMFMSIGSIAWVILAGKPALELAICVEAAATPLFGLVMLVFGYYYGSSNKRTAMQDLD